MYKYQVVRPRVTNRGKHHKFGQSWDQSWCHSWGRAWGRLGGLILIMGLGPGVLSFGCKYPKRQLLSKFKSFQNVKKVWSTVTFTKVEERPLAPIDWKSWIFWVSFKDLPELATGWLVSLVHSCLVATTTVTPTTTMAWELAKVKLFLSVAPSDSGSFFVYCFIFICALDIVQCGEIFLALRHWNALQNQYLSNFFQNKETFLSC